MEAVSGIKNKLNHETDNLNCYVQTNFDSTIDDKVDNSTHDDSFDESDFHE